MNSVELPPGAWPTQRHWHRTNDELVIVISGELVLVTNDGEEVLHPGDGVGFAWFALSEKVEAKRGKPA